VEGSNEKEVKGLPGKCFETIEPSLRHVILSGEESQLLLQNLVEKRDPSLPLAAQIDMLG
jgi:hypothetical protein